MDNEEYIKMILEFEIDIIIGILFKSKIKEHYELVDLPTVWKSMKLHASQFTWYRKLFIVFSSYSYVNHWITL